MIDINLLRPERGGNPEIVKESQRKRNASVELVDEVIEMDKKWREAKFEADSTLKLINIKNKEIGALMKAKKKDEAAPLLLEKEQIIKTKDELVKITDALEVELNKKLSQIGNIVHESVIDAVDEEQNAVVSSYWPSGRDEAEDRAKKLKLIKEDGKGVPGLYSHHEVLEKIAGYDQVRGAKVSGRRGYFLTGVGVDLNLAVLRYGLDFLENRGFTKLWTPFFMNKEMMSKTAQLEEFDEALYKIVGSESAVDKSEDHTKYLIATSEQPISAFHAGEWFVEPEKELPKKYAGSSTCFRKEAGAYGRDTWGLFRVHQFEKVEQFVLTDTDKSWEMHEELLGNSKEFYESLEIPYRVVSIVSGALNNAAAKKYDLEGWFPFQSEYKELVSCSNCTDYQSRSLDIRIGAKKADDKTKKFAHALNCTLSATGRTICAILENHQTEDGVRIPPALVPYMNGKTFIPFASHKKVPVKAKDVVKGVDGLKLK